MSSTLFDAAQERLAEARSRVQSLDASEEVKAAALKRLTRLDRATRMDLSLASREIEAVHADLDAGEVPLYD